MKNHKVMLFLTAWLFSLNALAKDQYQPTSPYEWNSFIESLQPLGDEGLTKLKERFDIENPQLRQEYYRHLLSLISYSYLGLMSTDPEHPDFMPTFKAQNFAAPNPDDAYYLTPIESDGIYRISGFRGTVRIVKFSIGTGLLFANGGSAQAGAVLDDYDLDKIAIEANGYFEVILSAERPADYKGNWWKLDSKATYILVRQMAYDWINEVDGRFAISRLDTPAIKPRTDSTDIEQQFRHIPSLVKNWTEFLSVFTGPDFIGKKPNHVEELGNAGEAGGVSSQHYAIGQFQLKDDEALIYETTEPKSCNYWSIQLTDMLLGSIDVVNRQSNLNGFTTSIDSDGKVRYVIAARDPGVPNWLDSAGYTEGFIWNRQLDCTEAEPLNPSLSKVKLKDLRKYLPSDTPTVSLEERDKLIRIRREGAQLRRRW